MASVTIITQLHCAATGTINLPEGKTWGDVTDWYVKWGRAHLTFKGGERAEMTAIRTSGIPSTGNGPSTRKSTQTTPPSSPILASCWMRGVDHAKRPQILRLQHRTSA